VSAGGAALGTIELQLWKPEQLTRQGSHLFQASGAPAAGKRAEVVSGTLEAANFDVVRGVVDLVRISRTYDAVHRMIESFREIDDRTARGIGNR
jgi:flagellar basal body rod protein FlgG